MFTLMSFPTAESQFVRLIAISIYTLVVALHSFRFHYVFVFYFFTSFLYSFILYTVFYQPKSTIQLEERSHRKLLNKMSGVLTVKIYKPIKMKGK